MLMAMGGWIFMFVIPAKENHKRVGMSFTLITRTLLLLKEPGNMDWPTKAVLPRLYFLIMTWMVIWIATCLIIISKLSKMSTCNILKRNMTHWRQTGCTGMIMANSQML